MRSFDSHEWEQRPKMRKANSENVPQPKCKYLSGDGRCRFRLITKSDDVPSFAGARVGQTDAKFTMFCLEVTNPERQASCNQYNSRGKVFDIGRVNWANDLASAVRSATSGDIIVVPSNEMRERGEEARSQIRPRSRISFVVDPDLS